MGKFSGKVAIITGASSGIGAATAVALAKEGAKVTICGRDRERLSKTSKLCNEAGSEVLEIVGDLIKIENVELVVNKTTEKFGAIDILINNAGYGMFGSIGDLAVDDFDNIFMANVRAPVFLCKYALPHLKKTKGCVVNVSSVAGLRAKPTVVPYGMTKCALDHFTRGFSAECSPLGIRVNSINPAAVLTKFGDRLGLPKEFVDGYMERLKSTHHFGLMQPESIADAILFLCSSPHITGISLPVDSGSLNA
ncbi:putative oxidoreductase TM_0325 [Styela clava]|uniref:uncharacterized oxidoreductase TM_0325-like n=1 Tax=Styela clava TaxID=7725 RepID=UPI001939C42A|nr:uncharacterized oxidoreductase TM_0325-like [Styela clava]